MRGRAARCSARRGAAREKFLVVLCCTGFVFVRIVPYTQKSPVIIRAFARARIAGRGGLLRGRSRKLRWQTTTRSRTGTFHILLGLRIPSIVYAIAPSRAACRRRGDVRRRFARHVDNLMLFQGWQATGGAASGCPEERQTDTGRGNTSVVSSVTCHLLRIPLSLA